MNKSNPSFLSSDEIIRLYQVNPETQFVVDHPDKMDEDYSHLMDKPYKIINYTNDVIEFGTTVDGSTITMNVPVDRISNNKPQFPPTEGDLLVPVNERPFFISLYQNLPQGVTPTKLFGGRKKSKSKSKRHLSRKHRSKRHRSKRHRSKRRKYHLKGGVLIETSKPITL